MQTWNVRVVLVIFGAWLAADAADSAIAYALGHPSSSRPRLETGDGAVRDLGHYLEPILRKRLFGGALVVEDVEAPPAPYCGFEEPDPRERLTNCFANGVRIVPHFEGGVAVGFKLYSLRPGSTLVQLGFRTGDIVTAVNGYPTDTPERALEAYERFKDEETLTVDLLRDGSAKRVIISIASVEGCVR